METGGHWSAEEQGFHNVVPINSALLFSLNILVIVSIIFHWDACVAPVNIWNSGFTMLVPHAC